MVTQYGMSDKLGPLAYGDNEEEVFLGHSIARTQNLSDETQTIVDEEIHRLVDESFEHARKIITDRISRICTRSREALLEYETLSGEEIEDRAARRADPVARTRRRRTSRPGPARPSARRPRQEGAAGAPIPDGLEPEPAAKARPIDSRHMPGPRAGRLLSTGLRFGGQRVCGVMPVPSANHRHEAR